MPDELTARQCREARDATGLSAVHWARLVGVDRITVGRWEQRGCVGPWAAWLTMWANAVTRRGTDECIRVLREECRRERSLAMSFRTVALLEAPTLAEA